MGHAPVNVMVSALRNRSWLHTDISADQIRKIFTERPCVICTLAKKNRPTIPTSVSDPKDHPIGNLISGDIIGPISPSNREGHKYFFLFVDRRTSYYHAYTSATKDGFITALSDVYEFYKKYGHKINIFRSDSENILVHGDVERFLSAQAVDQQYSLPYAHHQNLVERHVQTVTKAVSTAMHDQVLLGASFWDYALFHVINLKNNTPNIKTNGKTPMTMVTKQSAVDLRRRFLFPFGAPVAVRIPERTWKFDIRNELGIYLGESVGSINGGLVYYPSTHAMMARGDLIPLNIRNEDFQKYSSIRNTIKDSTSITDSELIIDVPSICNPDEEHGIVPGREPPATPMAPAKFNAKSMRSIVKGMITRNMSKLSALVANAFIRKTDELTEALQGPEKAHWIEALKTEVDSILNVTESLVPETPADFDYDIISATVVLKKKMKDATTVDKYKVRIPLCGNQLLAKKDYNNPTYSPTVSMLTHTALLQLSIYDRMWMATFDTVAAYLYQIYPSHLKPLYVRFPRKLALACGLDPNTLYRVMKYMYGLPDAGLAYYTAYTGHLEENGYRRTVSDPCLFVKVDRQRNLRTYVWFHVDDTFVSSTHKEELELYETIMSHKFRVTADYDVNSHLGITMTKQSDGSVKLTQPKLVAQILEENESPFLSDYPATINRITDGYSESMDDTPYRKLLGQLMWLTHSRTDLMPSISYSATHSSQPTIKDYNELLKAVAFLRQTPDYGLTIHPRDESKDPPGRLSITAYVDAAYMSHGDASSHTGYCISLGSVEPKSFFHSKSVKQKLVATSSTHAELRALYDLVTNLIFLKHLMDELDVELILPILVHEDNQPAIDLVSSTTGRVGKSKHYLMLIQFLREQLNEGLYRLSKVPTDKNISNVLTKIVVGREFHDSFMKIMGHPRSRG